MHYQVVNSSWEELIINEGVSTDIALDEETADEGDDLFEDEGDEEGVIDVLSADVEDVHEVYVVE